MFASSTPESGFTAFHFLVTLGAFLAWSTALAGWGRLLARQWFRHELVLTLPLGTVVAVASAAVFGHLGALGPYWRALWGFFLLAGLYFAWREQERILTSIERALTRLWNSGWILRLAALVICVYFVTRFVATTFPQRHGDPLLYHLVGPRLWVEAGRIGLNENIPTGMLASYWEYLYLWMQEFFYDGSRGSGLIEAQLGSQWIHAFWGQALAAYLLHVYLGFYFARARWIPLVAFGAITAADLQWTAGLAKNDWGVVMWTLAGLVSCELGLAHARKRFLYLGAVCFGLAVTAKFNGVLVVAPALVLYGIRCYRDPRNPWLSLHLVGGGLATIFGVALPLLLRNYNETGNPIFPMLNGYFQSPWVSASFHELIQAVEPTRPSPLAALAQRLRELKSNGSPFWILPFGLLALACAPGRSARLKRLWLPLALALFPFFLFTFASGPIQEIRYLGTVLLLLAGLGTALTFEYVDLLRFQGARLAFGLVVLILFTATTKIPLHLYRKLPKAAWGEQALLEHSAGDAKAWLRANARAGESIILVADNETYYLLGWNPLVVTEAPALDIATRAAASLDEFLLGICQNSVRAAFLLDSRPEMGMHLRFPEAEPRFQAATAFRGASARVLAIAKLAKGAKSPEVATACRH